MEYEKDKNDTDDLFTYAKLGDTAKVNEIIEERKLNINITDARGCTALHNAALKGRCETVNYLLRNGAAVDPKITNDDKRDCGATPLIYAVRYGHVSVSELLIKQGANIHVVVNGMNLLEIAIKSDNSKTIELLLQKGFNIDQVSDLDGATPLIIAIVEHKHESLRFLLEKGVSYRKPGHSGDHPLFYAVPKRECAECIEMILKCVDKKEGKEGLLNYVNFKSLDKGSSPLHVACYLGNYHAAKTLVQYGADPKAEDTEGCTPSDLLDDLGDSNIVRVIRALLEKFHQRAK